ncbi:MAG: diacylglycerol kinase family protein [Candidatus Saccharimonadales bacterium]
MKTYPVIYNNKSGSSNQVDAIKQAFANYDAQCQFIYLDKNTTSALDALIKKGTDVIIAAGGDGTINYVASQIFGSKTDLGILPCGTLNHFSKDLHIPADINQAVRVIIEHHTNKIDVGMVNKTLFLNNSSLGIYTSIVRMRDKFSKKLGKWPAVVIGLIVSYLKLPYEKLLITIDTRSILTKSPLIFIGNNTYNIENIGFNNRTSLTNGKLCLYCIETISRLNVLILLLKSFFGVSNKTTAFTMTETESLTINSRRKHIDVSYDGEVVRLSTPIHYSIKPKALSVIIPK